MESARSTAKPISSSTASLVKLFWVRNTDQASDWEGIYDLLLNLRPKSLARRNYKAIKPRLNSVLSQFSGDEVNIIISVVLPRV